MMQAKQSPREWGWEAKARQITDETKPGDRVNVGWLSDSDPHNYCEATII